MEERNLCLRGEPRTQSHGKLKRHGERTKSIPFSLFASVSNFRIGNNEGGREKGGMGIERKGVKGERDRRKSRDPNSKRACALCFQLFDRSSRQGYKDLLSVRV